MKSVFITFAIVLLITAGAVWYLDIPLIPAFTVENIIEPSEEDKALKEIANSQEWKEIAKIMQRNMYLKKERARLSKELMEIETELLAGMQQESNWLSKNYYESTGDLPESVKKELSVR